ncbi:LysM peptidoglycan-binding domain-containing protein [Desulfosoma caldarium]|uniref:LysM repeat protein n=1 Tax=Desulfosoma caldarium TaxID=610254 RepID=A0A3N1UQQ1_9BACT|nr:penicillin-insensitive murein endopeptidase [Desulfosoma caldarium]ROQ90877.1 LysM repeat protein [Desulfosoma caldarium]
MVNPERRRDILERASYFFGRGKRFAGPHRFRAPRRRFVNLIGITATFCTCLAWSAAAQALTLSIGKPYKGRLVNGIQFPTHMGGYTVRNPELAYATPELIGSLLEAIEAVRDKYPNTVDLFIGDFSARNGGRLKGHKSHQNGRDVDVGMYALGNKRLDRFVPMHAGNLDVAKTWTFIEALIRTGRVQYLFVDRKIQKLLFDFALSRGFDRALLNRLFNDVGSRSTDAAIRHEPRHNDHIHVRFYAPWSTLAAQVNPSDTEKRALIELAQAGFLPKKVLYYVDKNQTDLASLAQSFGVRLEDLARWNHLDPHAPLTPGTPLVYYRRAFELEPVHLAESLKPRNLFPLEPVRVASVASLPPVDVSSWKRSEPQKVTAKTHTVRRGDTLWSLARAYGLSVTQLARMNNLSVKKPLPVGLKLIVGWSHGQVSAKPPLKASPQSHNAQQIIHKVAAGENLWVIGRRYHVDVHKIVSANKLSDPSKIKPGMRLKIPPPS